MIKIDEAKIIGDNTKIKNLGWKITQPIEQVLEQMYLFWLEDYKRE